MNLIVDSFCAFVERICEAVRTAADIGLASRHGNGVPLTANESVSSFGDSATGERISIILFGTVS